MPPEDGYADHGITVDLQDLNQKFVLVHDSSKVTPDDDDVVAEALRHTTEANVASAVRAMLERFRQAEKGAVYEVVYEVETDEHVGSSLVLLQGLEVEIEIRMRRRAAVVPDRLPDEVRDEVREHLASTVIPSWVTSLPINLTPPTSKKESDHG